MQDTPETIQLVAEQATVQKREVVTGKVRVSVRTQTQDEVVSASLQEENVTVERVAINREIDVAPQVRTEGDVTIVPVIEEILVVEKRLLLREELHIRRTVTQQTVETAVPLRQQHAVVEREGGETHRSEEEV